MDYGEANARSVLVVGKALKHVEEARFNILWNPDSIIFYPDAGECLCREVILVTVGAVDAQ